MSGTIRMERQDLDLVATVTTFGFYTTVARFRVE
jgi:hypothetical protein